jgi:hypothetical protein
MSGGTEKRAQILPSTKPEDTGFILPNYDFAGNVPTPKQIGVRRGGGLGDVYSAAKGIVYYTDVIGFGESSNRMTRGMPFSHLGINFFMKTGLTCSNGADMWSYFEGIPKGNGLGKNIQRAMAEMGMPALRGLAPGILEDSQAALNIKPVVNAAFGSVYPVCELRGLPVGNEYGQTVDPATGDVWVKGPVVYIYGRPYQARWVQKVDGRGNPIYIDRGEFDETPKTQNPDGTNVSPPPPEDFTDYSDSKKSSFVLAIVFLCGALAIMYSKK